MWCVIFLINRWTGFFMTSSSATEGNLHLAIILEIKSTGNYGFRPSTSNFPKGTCWTFHVGRQCKGCQYEHVCYKCNAKHPPSQCQFSHQPTRAPVSKTPDHNLLIQVLGSQPVRPVKVDRFENLLVGYSPALKTLLVDGFRTDFQVYYISELSSFESSNLRSALQSPDIVSAKLKKEIVAGRVVGVFKAPPFPNFRTSLIGIVPKKGS